MGRKPKPTNLKLRDDSQPCRINKREPKPPIGELEYPKHLSDVGRAKWFELVGLLKSMGICSPAESVLVELFVDAWEEYTQLRELIDQHGVMLPDGKRNPLLIDLNRTADFLRKCSGELGLSPASRAKIQVPEVGPEITIRKR
jgi:P27 family predicted phage terminase small subunit